MSAHSRTSTHDDAAGSDGKKRKRAEADGDATQNVLDLFTCAITGDLMVEPVVAEDGHHYEHAAIARWLGSRRVSPRVMPVVPRVDAPPGRRVTHIIT